MGNHKNTNMIVIQTFTLMVDNEGLGSMSHLIHHQNLAIP
jgi:hypothetical protein